MDKLWILLANQTSICLNSHQNLGCGWYLETSLSPPVIVLLTIPRWYFFCVFFACLSLHVVMPASCSLEATH